MIDDPTPYNPERIAGNLLKDNTAYIDLLLEFTWLIKGDTKEKELIKQYGKPHQQERYAYILMERLLQ